MFQDGLGTIYDKVERIVGNAAALCQLLNKENELNIVERTAQLCKADLVTNMVFEFPELQGVMGAKYALISGEDPQVASGIEEHYLPRFSQDALPQTTAGIIVSLADKLDTLVGYFGINKIPTGSQDPFALRRQALGLSKLFLLIILMLISESCSIQPYLLMELCSKSGLMKLLNHCWTFCRPNSGEPA